MAITTICDVYCCIETINNKYLAAECANPKLAEEYLAILDKVTVLIGLYGIVSNSSNAPCYDETQATAYLTEIATLTNCSETCGCS
jgi:hypothetical protein